MKKNISLTRQIAIIVSVLMLIINTILGIVLINQSRESLMASIKGRMLDISNTAAAMIDGDDFALFTENTKQTDAYKEAYKTIETFQRSFECDNIYAVRKVEGTEKDFVFVIDPTSPEGEFKRIIAYTDAMNNANRGKSSIDEEAVPDSGDIDENGNVIRYYTSFSPIKNTDGDVVGVVGVDFRKEWLDDQIIRETLTIGIGVAIAMLLSVAIVIVTMTGIRNRSKKIHDDLADLSGIIDELINKIDAEETLPKDIGVYEDNGRPIADELVSMGSKVHAMRDRLDHYLEYMSKKAYVDALTGVNNSSAYYNAVAKENEAIKKGDAAFAVLIFDINGLKSINDEYGHSIGDVFIIRAVDVMTQVMGKKNVYRVGGDEFIAIIDGATEETLKEIYRRIDEESRIVNSRPRPFKEEVSFSRGATLFTPSSDIEFKDVFKRADKLMYENKAEFYAKKNEKK